MHEGMQLPEDVRHELLRDAVEPAASRSLEGPASLAARPHPNTDVILKLGEGVRYRHPRRFVD